MRFDDALLQRVVDHAQRALPNECCGLLELDDAGIVREVFELENVAASPYRFEVASHDLLRIPEIEDRGNRPGIYHSHPLSEPVPSQTDLNFAAAWPGVPWLIVGVASGEPEVRCWRIEEGRVDEQQVERA